MAWYSSSSSSDCDEDIENAIAVVVAKNYNNHRRKWVHDINLNRKTMGEFHHLVKELEEDPSRYQMYFRMSKEEFIFLNNTVKEDIQKKNTQFRDAISSEEQLAVCLRYLATGNSFRSLGFSFRLGFSTVREIVRCVCDSIWNRLGSIVMPEPTEELWKQSAAKYKELWNFPNCIAAIDGKHVNIKCPIKAGSTFYNYKGTHSVVLLALVDAQYKFIAIDVGSYGRNSDGCIFSHSNFGRKLQSGGLSIPANTPLTENGEPLPHVIVGDEAFPLKPYLLRPYSRCHLGGDETKKIFNYRLSRARRVVENAFGILSSRWRIFSRPIDLQPKMVDKVVLASCCLHNMLCKNNELQTETEPELLGNETLSGALCNVDNIRRNTTREAFQVRENFRDYFNSPNGSVAWQQDIVRRGRIQN